MATIIATSSHNGGLLRARVGDDVLVRLPESPTTGFRWKVDVAPALLNLQSDTFDAGAGGGVGGGGLRTFRFHAHAAGDAPISLKRWREWEGETSVAERYRVTIHVE